MVRLHPLPTAPSLVQPPTRATSPAQLQPPPIASSPIQPPPLAPPQNCDATRTRARSGRKRKAKEEDNDLDEVPAKKKMARKQCIVCADDVPKNQFPKFPHKQDAEGKHSSDVCKKCCSEHLSHKVKNKDHEGVSCPQCSKLLEQSDVRNLASSRTYQEYVNNACKGDIRDERTLTFDQVPRQSSQEVHARIGRVPLLPERRMFLGLVSLNPVTHSEHANQDQEAFFAKDDGNIFNCRACKARYCLSYEVPFHEKQTCEDYQAAAERRNEDEKRSLDTVKQVSRPCPGCGINLDKFAGCDHVTCERIPGTHPRED
jgi:hypothetical protein